MGIFLIIVSLVKPYIPYAVCFFVGLCFNVLVEVFQNVGYTSAEKVRLLSRLVYRHDKRMDRLDAYHNWYSQRHPMPFSIAVEL